MWVPGIFLFYYTELFVPKKLIQSKIGRHHRALITIHKSILTEHRSYQQEELERLHNVHVLANSGPSTFCLATFAEKLYIYAMCLEHAYAEKGHVLCIKKQMT